MAIFNNGYPATYQPMYFQPQYQPNFQQTQQQPQIQQQTQQYPVVQGGFVRVRNENEARTYFVAPGNSVTFINEDSTYVFTKTVEMNQLDRPKFEKYRLVKEDDAPEPLEAVQKPVEAPAIDVSQFAMKADIDAFRAELETLRADVDTFRGDLYGIAGKKTASRKKEVTPDE